MRGRTDRFTLLLVLTGLLVAPAAGADLILSWSFDQENIVAQPDESLEIAITLWNDAASTETLNFGQMYGLGGTGAPPGGGLPLDVAYQVTLGSIISCERGCSVAPGGSWTFWWASLDPLSGSAPVGVYGPGEAQLQILENGGGVIVLDSSNLFTVTVVPEPRTVLLLGLGLGLFGLGIRRRRR